MDNLTNDQRPTTNDFFPLCINNVSLENLQAAKRGSTFTILKMARSITNRKKETLNEMLERMKRENEALHHLINAVKEQTSSIDKEIYNKSNQ